VYVKVTDFQEKVNRVRQMIRQQPIDGVLITQQKNFSWLTSGRGFVNLASERAVATILITDTTLTLIVNNIEAQRLIEEEIQGEFEEVQIFPWYRPWELNAYVKKMTGDGKIKLDTELESQWIQLRTVLTKDEMQRIRSLGRDTADAIEQTAFELKAGETEYEIAARLAAQCLKRGIEPVVNLVAVDQRAFIRRHPLPTNLTLQNYAMLVVCGRRQGQIVSATRLVHFGRPSEELIRKHRAVALVDSILIAKTRPGTAFSALFVEMKKAYETAGYPDEWTCHHQGGLSGYNSREILLLPDSAQVVQSGQVYAWNPSIAGVKSEDTLIIHEDGNEVITYTGNFPMIELEFQGNTLRRPDILIR
jgi:Xaa-Pro aminopeptidase